MKGVTHYHQFNVKQSTDLTGLPFVCVIANVCLLKKSSAIFWVLDALIYVIYYWRYLFQSSNQHTTKSS